MPPSPHPASLPTEALLEDCDVQRTRRSGPGGQHRNKVETAIVITHRPTGQRGEASERRSQEQNRQVAVFRLRVQLALAVRLPPPALLSERWIHRTPGRRLNVSATHDDFPALLAEALDWLAANGWDVKSVAESLAVSTSQLTRFLKLESQAIRQVNAARVANGLRPLQ